MSYEKYFDILHFPYLQKLIVDLPKHKGFDGYCMAGTGEVELLVVKVEVL